MPTPAAVLRARIRARIRDDIDDTLDRENRAAILADCLISRLIEVTLRDRSDYLAAVENEIIAKFEDADGQAVRRAMACRRSGILHLAIREELIDTGLDQALWRTTMDRIVDGAGEGFTPETLALFLAICERRGWEPPAALDLDS